VPNSFKQKKEKKRWGCLQYFVENAREKSVHESGYKRTKIIVGAGWKKKRFQRRRAPCVRRKRACPLAGVSAAKEGTQRELSKGEKMQKVGGDEMGLRVATFGFFFPEQERRPKDVKNHTVRRT